MPSPTLLFDRLTMQSTEIHTEVARHVPCDVDAEYDANALPFTQAGLFADDALSWPAVDTEAERLFSKVRFPWYACDENRTSALPSQTGLFGCEAVKIDRFHSGSSAFWDFRGYMLAGVPIGITATALPKNNPDRLIGLVGQHTSQGGFVFCDSGAFGAFCCGRSLDFASEVFPVYDRILRACTAPQNLRFVMPDVVGDPQASMALQMAHVDRIRTWMDASVACIFPLHSPSDALFLSAIEKVADGRKFSIGVPSNLEAWSLPELLAFCERHKPASIHMLGLGQAEKIQMVGQEVAKVSPLTEISCDSCTLIAHAGEGRRLTDRCRTRLADAIDWVMNDPTADIDVLDLATFVAELLTVPDFLGDSDVLKLAAQFSLDPQSLLTASHDEGLSAVLGLIDPDEQWFHEALCAFVREHIYVPHLERLLRGPIRAWEVARLAGMPDELEYLATP